jgi:TonB family protein
MGSAAAEVEKIVDQEPVIIFRAAPRFPSQLEGTSAGGTVFVSFVVSKSGKVVDLKIVSSTNSDFDEASLNAVRQWRYKPAMKDGKPVEFAMHIPVQFMSGSDDENPTKVLEFPRDFGPGDSPPEVTIERPIVYPYELERKGVHGEAKVRVLISKVGEVLRVTVLTSSRPEFGLALAAAVQGFYYTSAIKEGSCYRCMTEVIQEFDASHAPFSDDSRLLSLEANPGGVHPIAQLDAQPHPVSIKHPLYPMALAGTTEVGNATVEFLVQEDGLVRLPRIVHASRPEFGYAAAEAVASWRFEPPKLHGKPVVARARVSFKFKPKAADPQAQ